MKLNCEKCGKELQDGANAYGFTSGSVDSDVEGFRSSDNDGWTVVCPECAEKVFTLISAAEAEDPREVGAAAAIIADHLAKRIYDEVAQGYIDCVYMISEMAREFVREHVNTDWEAFYEVPGNPCCWDDAVMLYGERKLEELKSKKAN